MIDTNSEQLQALAAATSSTRELIEQLVCSGASAQQLSAINEQIQALAASLHSDNQRPIPHFNYSLAATDPNHTLPYSPLCGPYNPIAPPVAMRFDAQKTELHGTVSCRRAYEGPKGLVHGGVIAGIYDQLLALLTTCSGRPSYTAYLNIQYKLPTPLYTELSLKAWIASIDGRKAIIKGQCMADGKILTEAEGLFIQVLPK